MVQRRLNCPAPESPARKGTRRFVRDRLLRLGVPFALSVLLVWPLPLWVAYRAAGHDVTPWWVFSHRDPLPDSGSLWFVEVLLLFCLAYALVGRPRPEPFVLTGGHLVAVTAGVVVCTFGVRLWQALLFAVVEAVLVVGGSVWLLGWAQRRLSRDGPLAAALARGAFAAFLIQGPVLILLAVAARPLPFPAEAKAFLVAATAIAVSFGAGWLLTTRTRLARFL